jgi:hypothetical protein
MIYSRSRCISKSTLEGKNTPESSLTPCYKPWKNNVKYGTEYSPIFDLTRDADAEQVFVRFVEVAPRYRS